MKKNAINRSRSRSSRIARASRQRRQECSQSTQPETAKQPLLQRGKRVWEHLEPWQKVLSAAIPVAVAAYACLPHFTIEPFTTNVLSPASAEFLFKNEGRFPAKGVKVACAIDAQLEGGQGSMSLGNLVLITPVSDSVSGGSSFTRGCSISAPGLLPKSGGRVTVSIEYNFPIIHLYKVDRASFKFSFDSKSGGYIFVPDIAS